MRVASFFAGIGGFDLGFEQAGMKVVFQCEIDPFCQQVLKKHWPDVPLHNDITTLTASHIPEADVYCGGFPCQDVSLANQGKRQGLEGDRSGLFFDFAEIVKENKPRWIVIENVVGLLNSQEGRDFKVVVERLDKIGYGLAWRVLDAKYFGTPQRRRRVFIVGSFRSISAAKVLFDDETFEVFTRPGKSKEYSTSASNGTGNKSSTVYSIQHAGIGRNHLAGPQGRGYRNDGETWTLDHRGGADAICSTNDPLRVRKTSRIPAKLDRRRYQALGNAVCVPVVKWIGERILEVEKSIS